MSYKVMRTGSSVSVTKRREDGEQEIFFCRDVRGVLVWPVGEFPGYVAVFGLRDQMNDHGKFPLVLLGEVVESNPGELFKELFKKAYTLSCREFYADLQRENMDLYMLFKDYSRHHAQLRITLKPARLVKKPRFALNLIQEWTKHEAVEASKGTSLERQLDAMSVEDPEEQFFAVKGLALILGSLEVKPWQAGSFFQSRGGVSRAKDVWGAFI